MTIYLDPQTVAKGYGKSKTALEEALNTNPERVVFINPTPWGNEVYEGKEWLFNHSDVVLLDPATQKRFASVKRHASGRFSVT